LGKLKRRHNKENLNANGEVIKLMWNGEDMMCVVSSHLTHGGIRWVSVLKLIKKFQVS